MFTTKYVNNAEKIILDATEEVVIFRAVFHHPDKQYTFTREETA